MVRDLLRRPTGVLPLVISGGFLAILLSGLAQGTLVRQPDEGTAAHLFQILMPLQVIVIGVFAASWLPRNPRSAIGVLALQTAAFLAVLAIVHARNL
jgi:uncharacterized membrane protein YoaK (UPF0700 family)